MKLKESLLSRRDFFTGLIYGSLASVAAYIAYPVVRFLYYEKKLPLPKEVTITLGDLEKVSPNSAVYFQYGYLPGILVRTEAGEVKAFSARCTHLDCNVSYKPDTKTFHCACHEGYFDINGKNIAGPPPRPLLAFTVKQAGDVMVITCPEEGGEEAKKA
jgi:cytochrome b6-f complex iron-sulfur subunit